MIKIETVLNNEIKIDRKEIFRYLGYKNNTVDEAIVRLAEECVCKIRDALSCKACYDRFPVLREEKMLNLGFTDTVSESLSKNLTGCDEIFVFTATIGIDADRLINRYSKISPAHALVMLAAGAVAIEEWCDILCGKLADEANSEGKFLRPRFSPGYGDFPIEKQTDIFRVLDCSRKIGVMLTKGLLMIPTKSVSAIIGISNEDTKCILSGCEMCSNKNCEFRRI
ncbi:MAG: Vitamin B12 dependent methionine synthase activation subunit [Clostridia bacterium]|nr:Vitamin B12 dependent methionine synthase activation subunit [Clostridia bacterium]